jgi:SAM-dependent methyltransferase
MWWYSANVLLPAKMLKRIGLPISDQVIGDPPSLSKRRGLGPYFSARHRTPVLLKKKTKNDHLVEGFEELAESYSEWVRPFSQPIFYEALEVMQGYISPDARVLDAGCGPGRELQEMARLVPEGEVVGIDLSAAMVTKAHETTSADGTTNCAFFQADVGDLPKVFEGKFDLVYSCLAHHHYPDPAAAARSILRSLRPGGIYCIVDPGPSWYNAISSPLARWADPGWVGFHDPQQFRALLDEAGFSSTCWFDLLPGFGMAVGQRHEGAQKRPRPRKSRASHGPNRPGPRGNNG